MQQAQQSRQSPGPKGKGAAGSSATSSVSDRMQATFGIHLEEVKKLLDAIRKRIFENVANCFQIVQVCLYWPPWFWGRINRSIKQGHVPTPNTYINNTRWTRASWW